MATTAVGFAESPCVFGSLAGRPHRCASYHKSFSVSGCSIPQKLVPCHHYFSTVYMCYMMIGTCPSRARDPGERALVGGGRQGHDGCLQDGCYCMGEDLQATTPTAQGTSEGKVQVLKGDWRRLGDGDTTNNIHYKTRTQF